MNNNGCEEEEGSTLDQLAMRQSLAQVICRMTSDPTLRDDLMQEALLHLWLMETRRPGQTRSWYLQSCKYHLQHYLASGRSIDSAKRRDGQLLANEESEEHWPFPEHADSGDTVFTSVSARELMVLLGRHLQPQEKAVLDCLAEGLGPREIGRELKMSHTMVIRHRRKIACLLTRLESLTHAFRNARAISTNGHRNGVRDIRRNSHARANGHAHANGDHR